jgi:hypothetical protein
MATAILEKKRIFHEKVVLSVHPRSISKMKGIKNHNVDILKKRFQLQSLKIVPDPSLDEDKLALSL